jgi:flagellar FliJ protein
MSKKPEPGKKFKYGLDTVLKVRAIREKQEQERFGERKRELLTEQEREEIIKTKRIESQDELRGRLKKTEEIKDFQDVIRRQAHLEVLKKNLDQQIEKVIEATENLERQRQKLVVAMKDKKVMQKHKYRKLQEYNLEMNRLETKFLDEIGTMRFVRDKLMEKED